MNKILALSTLSLIGLVSIAILPAKVIAENLHSDSYVITFGNFNIASGEKSSANYNVTDTVGQTSSGPYGSYGNSSYFIGSGFQYIYQIDKFNFAIIVYRVNTSNLILIPLLNYSAVSCAAAASSAVRDARFAIEKGKKLVLQVPADSDLGKEIEQVLTQASQSWDAALLALSDAKKSSAKVGSAKNEAIAKDYKLLATSTASLALAGAKSVQASIFFIESV